MHLSLSVFSLSVIIPVCSSSVFLEVPSDQNFTLGEITVLPCKVNVEELQTTLQLRWVKDGTLLLSSDDKIEQSRLLTNWNPVTGDFSLLILDTELEDIGDYCCKVLDTTDVQPRLIASATASLRTPSLSSPLCYAFSEQDDTDRQVEAGETTIFVCEFPKQYSFDLSLQWQQNGTDVGTNVNKVDSSLYYFATFAPEDTGTILQCHYKEIPSLSCTLPHVNVLYPPIAEIEVIHDKEQKGSFQEGETLDVQVLFRANPMSAHLHWTVHPLQRYSFRRGGHAIEIHEVIHENGFVNVSCRIVNDVGATVAWKLIEVKSQHEGRSTNISTSTEFTETETTTETSTPSFTSFMGKGEGKGQKVNSSMFNDNSSSLLPLYLGIAFGVFSLAVIITIGFICVITCNKRNNASAVDQEGELRVTYDTNGVTEEVRVQSETPMSHISGDSIILNPSNLAQANEYAYSNSSPYMLEAQRQQAIVPHIKNQFSFTQNNWKYQRRQCTILYHFLIQFLMLHEALFCV
ncbi:hypothetical protein BSL78_04529 [Apostichopus japonicus]|uniref:Ig-like domain-containing protein n=1 Tax=Stichopus japonicus TaxID=307972 RepID=A0A2G8LE63_STIJA|nr:hypothetical protein BSL78_04529 [Apostichopus japonicus]